MVAACLAFGAPAWPAEEPGDQPAAKPRADHGFEVVELAYPEDIASSLPESGAWLPVYVELKATAGRTVKALLEGRVGGAREGVQSRHWVEVSPGAPRRAWTYLRVPPGEGGANVKFEVKTAAGEVVARGDGWRASAFDTSERNMAFLVAGSSLGVLIPWADQVPISGRSLQAAAEGWPGKMLPDSVLGYSAFDVVIIEDLGSDQLEPAQVAALRAWVHLGGLLVLAPSSLSGEVFRTGIAAELLGPALGETRLTESFAPGSILTWTRGTLLDAKALDSVKTITKERPVALVDPLQANGVREVRALPHGPAGDLVPPTRLYAEFPYGRGIAGVLTLYAPPKVEAEEVHAAIWEQVLQWNRGDAGDSLARAAARFQASELESLLHDTSRDVGLTFITGVIGVYLLLVGPGLYFLLKRWNRLPAVVWVEPLLVVLYLGVIFGTGYITKGVLTKTKLLTFISHAEGAPLAVRSSYLTIFSADEETYRIDCPRGALVHPLFFNEKEERPVVLSRSEKGALSLEDYRLGHWEQGHVANWEVMDLAPGGLEVEVLPSQSEAPRVTVRNGLPYPVLEGVVYRNRTELPLPRIEPGETVTLGAESGPAEGGKGTGGGGEKAAPAAAAEKERSWKRALLQYRRGGAGRARGELVAAAVLDRSDADFQVDKRTSLKERVDLYLLHGAR